MTDGVATAPTPSAGTARTVTYKKYDPAAVAKGKRINHLARSSTSTTRVLGSSGTQNAAGVAYANESSDSAANGSHAAQAVNGISGMTNGHDSAVKPTAAAPHEHLSGSRVNSPRSTELGNDPMPHQRNGDYFVDAHSESTANSIIVRQRERERAHSVSKTSITTSASSASPRPNSIVSDSPRLGSHTFLSVAPAARQTRPASFSGYEAGASPAGLGMAQMPVLSTSVGISTRAGPSRPTDEDRSTQLLSGSNPPATSPPLQPAQPVQYRPFIPPSAYVTSPTLSHSGSSVASSPGAAQLHQTTPQSGAQYAAHVANQLSSAFQRGLSNVNGVVNATSSNASNSSVNSINLASTSPLPLRFPQSATNVANAVWNKLPPAMQALRNELADPGSVNWSTALSGQSSLAPTTIPPTARSVSMNSFLISDGKEQVAAQNQGEAPDPHGVSNETPNRNNLVPQRMSSTPIAAQLRLEYANAHLPRTGLMQHNSHTGAVRSGTVTRRDPPSGVSTPGSVTSFRQSEKAPYKPGYQPPHGVRRSRTEDFFSMRNKAANSSAFSLAGTASSRNILEEERLLRRLDKLVQLHFPDQAPLVKTSDNSHSSGDGSLNNERPLGIVRSGSDRSLAESVNSQSTGIGSVSPRKSGFRKSTDMLRGVVRGMSRVSLGNASDLRAADQSIVKWQDDTEVSKCSICFVPFSLVTRKHHCRLCGRVVCYLPPNANGDSKAGNAPDGRLSEAGDAPVTPSRSVRCSTFIIYECYDHMGVAVSNAQEADKQLASGGADYCLNRGIVREVDLGDGPTPVPAPGAGFTQRDADAFEARLEALRAEEIKKGVRVCRDCLNSVLKRQKKLQPKLIESWYKLYQFLMNLQREVEAALPTLAELRTASPVTVDAVKAYNSARKRILQELASYDLLAKRIRDLPPPTPTTPTITSLNNLAPAGQERLQKAIYTRTSLFLSEKMALIKSLGGLQIDKPPPKPAKTDLGGKPALLTRTRTDSTTSQREEEERAARLAVLYEQEALVSGYLEDAQARRQFEDASALKISLSDLRSEIASLVA